MSGVLAVAPALLVNYGKLAGKNLTLENE